MARILIALLALMLLGAGEPPADRLSLLRHGINITNWFRFPPSRDPAALRSYLDDRALRELKHAGFSFIRLPVQPELLTAPEPLADAVLRAERQGLAVVLALFATDWHLETDASDRQRLITTWRSIASLLRRFDPAMTFPEVLNEPVFAGNALAWGRLQHQALAEIRAILPTNTVVLTGADWGSVTGLLALRPEADPNVIYSFHSYEPAELTALGAYRPGLDAAAMARLPFPVADPESCNRAAATTAGRATTDLMRFYCTQRWDAARIADRIGEAGAWARLHHTEVLAGEFGASHRLNAPARLAWLAAVRAACEEQRIGWALWGYDDSMGFALHPPGDRGALDADVLRALGLPGRTLHQ
jgi:endoglucanase